MHFGNKKLLSSLVMPSHKVAFPSSIVTQAAPGFGICQTPIGLGQKSEKCRKGDKRPYLIFSISCYFLFSWDDPSFPHPPGSSTVYSMYIYIYLLDRPHSHTRQQKQQAHCRYSCKSVLARELRTYTWGINEYPLSDTETKTVSRWKKAPQFNLILKLWSEGTTHWTYRGCLGLAKPPPLQPSQQLASKEKYLMHLFLRDAGVLC